MPRHGSHPLLSLRTTFRDRLVASVEAARDSLTKADANEAAHRCRVALKRARARLARTAAPDAAWGMNAMARAMMAKAVMAKAVMATMSASRNTADMANAAHLAAAGARPQGKAARADLARLPMRAKSFPAVSDEDLTVDADALQRDGERAFTRAYGRTGAERRHEWRKRHKEVQVATKMLGPGSNGRNGRRPWGKRSGAERDFLLLEDRIRSEPRLTGGRRTAAQALRSARVARRVLGAQAGRLGARVYL